MDKKDIKQIFDNIKKDGYKCYVSEAQLRDVFAIYLNKHYKNSFIYPEFTIPDEIRIFKNKKITFDLMMKDGNNNYLFEFKYKTKAFKYTDINDCLITLANQKDTTNGRYDVWEDICRIEQYIKKNNALVKIKKGFFIFITNNMSYINSNKENSASCRFLINEGPHKSGTKKWAKPSDGNKNNQFDLIILNDYEFKYEEYSTINNEIFKILIVEIK